MSFIFSFFHRLGIWFKKDVTQMICQRSRSVSTTCGLCFTREKSGMILLVLSMVRSPHGVVLFSHNFFTLVFVGEMKDGQVSGFHNWIQILLEEKAGRLDYKGYIKPRRRGRAHDDVSCRPPTRKKITLNVRGV